MRSLRASAVLLAALAAVVSWPPSMAGRGLRPDFLLLAVVVLGLHANAAGGTAAGIAAGLLVAPLTAEPFGLDAAILGTCGFLSSRARVYLRFDHPGVQSWVAGGLALASGLARLLRLEASAADPDSLRLLGPILVSASLTGVVAPVAVLLLRAARLVADPAPWRGPAHGHV